MNILIKSNNKQNPQHHNQSDGEYVRLESPFRNWVTLDGSPGPSGSGGFKAEKGRYHLYVSYACPWAHRTLIFRKLKQLEAVIGFSVVHPEMGEISWHFNKEFSGSTDDHVNGFSTMQQVYQLANLQFDGVVTVPVLWDKKKSTIVNNESSEIIRMLNSSFNEFTDNKIDYYPLELRDEINELNKYIYDHVNNGVYRCGFATSQKCYNRAFDRLFSALDELELRLSGKRYLLGDVITEADWRLLPTLLRFDPVYVGHFKCNLKRIADYPNLSNYLRDLYQQPGVAETFNLEHVKTHYYKSHISINPTRIVPKGPTIDYLTGHDRNRF